jgi:hypothetical protein
MACSHPLALLQPNCWRILFNSLDAKACIFESGPSILVCPRDTVATTPQGGMMLPSQHNMACLKRWSRIINEKMSIRIGKRM